MLYFTQPIKDIEDFIINKQEAFQAMVDHLQMIVILGFVCLLLPILSLIYFNYKIYRQTSMQHVERLKLEVEKELLQKYDMTLKPEYQELLKKHHEK
ncbi:hypothetical protein [Macrococcoides caseolyticum]|uniref:hypothetical protein n=1 Tax=Macrococcoides caseolyticum TaxID=69966 RepID=UPI001F38292B|nr:hypothetical protein [Macrococcus caseolyticus]MCE4956793.1 hypothetical protein [Macrococcus caseolyticus]